MYSGACVIVMPCDVSVLRKKFLGCCVCIPISVKPFFVKLWV